jgi:hypothetical protein
MNHSESIVNIAAALVRAQGKFPPILRTKTAEIKSEKANYKFRYAPLDEILRDIRPTMIEEGLALMQGVEGFNLVTTILHSSGEWISHSMDMPHAYPSPRAFGSELSFRRRYSLTAVLGLAPEEDDDGAAAEADLNKGKKAKSSITPTGGVWESLDIDTQNHLLDIEHRVRTLLKKSDVAGAYAELIADDLDGKEDCKVGLWSRFDSKERRALGDYGDKYREEHNQPPRKGAKEREAA